MMPEVILKTDFADLGSCRRGKVRDIYELDGRLLIVATDRISAFDVVLPTGIPHKGEVLTALSAFWFRLTAQVASSHFLTAEVKDMPPVVQRHSDVLGPRSMLVRRAEVIPVECVVRGYLAGSGWREYQERGSCCGVRPPKGLAKASRLEEPIFTPTTKAESGHDISLTYDDVIKLVGEEVAGTIRDRSISLYKWARDYALGRGIIIADTKFEWGMADGEVILIDEVLTPDSSRFWPLEGYEAGKEQPSFDKQIVRDFLEESGWDKSPPAPVLPEEVVRKTSEKYLEIHQLLTGTRLH